jgi:hypothetical protein
MRATRGKGMAMRNTVVLMATLATVMAGSLARNATAGVTIDLLFTGINGNPIAPTDTVTVSSPSGDVLTMAVMMRNDEVLTAAVFSLNYDLAGEELDVVSASNWAGIVFDTAPTRFFGALAGLQSVTSSFVGSFNGAINPLDPLHQLPPAGGAYAAGYQMGTVTWTTTNASSDGEDIISGLFNVGVDVFDNYTSETVNPRVLFRGATVNLVPEPGTGSLLGLGLAGLVIARWHRRR